MASFMVHQLKNLLFVVNLPPIKIRQKKLNHQTFWRSQISSSPKNVYDRKFMIEDYDSKEFIDTAKTLKFKLTKQKCS